MSLKVFLPFVFALSLAQPAAAVAVSPAGAAAADLSGKDAAAVAANGAPDSAGVGRWREHELSFTYSGFTTKYSCDGLADKVRGLLRSLGARTDLKVVTYGCSSLDGGPTEFPRVKLRFAALEPHSGTVEPAAAPTAGDTAAAKPSAAAPSYGHVIGREAPRLRSPATGGSGAADGPDASPVPGAWRMVRFDRDRPRSLDPGDCELLEQFRDRVLPLFAVRAMDDHTRCIPYQLSGTSLALAFEVFAPLAAADTVRAGRR